MTLLKHLLGTPSRLTKRQASASSHAFLPLLTGWSFFRIQDDQDSCRIVEQTVADMETNGESVPDPLSLQKYSGKFMVRTTPEVHRRLAVQAMESGVSLNRLVNSRLQEHGG